MRIVRTINDLRKWIFLERREGRSVGLVPTMGSVHPGHLSLVEIARHQSDKVVATIFVNPLQFSEKEDFNQYPRNETLDCDRFRRAGVNLLFVPSHQEIYGFGHSTTVDIGRLGNILEGNFRPHFFTGVATIVTKLLILILPDIAVFGEKDYQQLCVIKKLVVDLNLPVEIIGGKTIRETDGLAISSRNRYLSKEERKRAPELYRAICSLAEDLRSGKSERTSCLKWKKQLIIAGFDKVEYLVKRDSQTLEKENELGEESRVLAAAWLGETRLIDNIIL